MTRTSRARVGPWRPAFSMSRATDVTIAPLFAMRSAIDSAWGSIVSPSPSRASHATSFSSRERWIASGRGIGSTRCAILARANPREILA